MNEYTSQTMNTPGSIYQMVEILKPDGTHLVTVIGELDAEAVLALLNAPSSENA